MLKRKYPLLLFVFIAAIFLQWPYFNEFPAFIQADTQANHYALAIGFLSNHFNFFHPQTFALNAPFGVPIDHNITDVDIPLIEYIAALLMKTFGTSAPWCFHLLMLFYSLVGFYFLYKATYLILKNQLMTAFVTLFAFTSPVYCYYQSGFLPTIPSIANCFIAFYFYLQHRRSQNNKYFIYALFFLTLAALCRTAFVIPLLAMLIFELWEMIVAQKFNTTKILLFLASAICIVGGVTYNSYLAHQQDDFYQLLKDTQNVQNVIYSLQSKWLFDYFSETHYGILLCLCTILFYAWIMDYPIKTTRILLCYALMVIGYGLYILLTLVQFPDKDYYFLDTLYFPLILFLIILFKAIPEQIMDEYKQVINLSLLLLSVLLLLNAVSLQKERRITSPESRQELTENNFKAADRFLDSLKVLPAAKMLVIDAYSQNIPLLLMNRKGYVTDENNKSVLTWPFDYAVIQNRLITEVVSTNPDIINDLERVASNGKITLYKKYSSNKISSVAAFLGLKKIPLYTQRIDFDITVAKGWENTKLTFRSDTMKHTVGFVSDKNEFGITFKGKNIIHPTDKPQMLILESRFLKTSAIHDCNIVVSIVREDKTIYYWGPDLKKYLNVNNKWQKVIMFHKLPKGNWSDCELSVYIWNKGRNNIYYDDFGFKIY